MMWKKYVIATACGLAMTVGDGGRSHFAGSAAVVDGVYRGTAHRPFPTLEYENPPILRNRGIFIKICSSQYAERILATGRAVSARLTPRRIHQARIGTGTAGRAVLLDCRQAQPTGPEFASGGSPQKSPVSSETGDFQSKLFEFHTKSTGTPGTAFPTGRIPYAEREPATSRVGPMV